MVDSLQLNRRIVRGSDPGPPPSRRFVSRDQGFRNHQIRSAPAHHDMQHGGHRSSRAHARRSMAGVRHSTGRAARTSVAHITVGSTGLHVPPSSDAGGGGDSSVAGGDAASRDGAGSRPGTRGSAGVAWDGEGSVGGGGGAVLVHQHHGGHGIPSHRQSQMPRGGKGPEMRPADGAPPRRQPLSQHKLPQYTSLPRFHFLSRIAATSILDQK